MMGEKIFIVPANGRRVRHEVTRQVLSTDGAAWDDTPYLRRRLRDGDVTRVSPPSKSVTGKTVSNRKLRNPQE